ncbi:MAG TPA: DUF3592 domain-containing protein [Opitutaceae bacterium]|nr:DUF3592 domain-containing protein [Opitutaceae bacterium]
MQMRGVIIGAAFAIIGAGVAVYGIGEVKKARATMNWPSTQGRVIRSEIVRYPASKIDQPDTYGPAVEYEYVSNGRKLTGNNISFGVTGASESNHGFADDYVAKYPAGKAINVFFDPANPQESVLERGASGKTYISLGIGLIFVITGCFFTVIFWLMPKT